MQTKAKLGKSLKEKSYSELYLELSFKAFVKLFMTFKLTGKNLVYFSIVTPALYYTGRGCVRFHYSMYGNEVGRLSVRTGPSTEVWSKYGNQEKPWHKAEIEVDMWDDTKVSEICLYCDNYLIGIILRVRKEIWYEFRRQ